MLTVELKALEGSGWRLEHGQRVRVHLGTVEVMSRVVLFGTEEVVPGVDASRPSCGWRLPVVASVR